MNIYLTSDSHFGHSKPFIVEARGFTSIDDLNEAMITTWNECIKPEDTVYHLGDFAWRNPLTFLSKLGSKAFEEQKLEEAEAYLKQVKSYQDLMVNLSAMAKSAGLTIPTTKVVKPKKLVLVPESKPIVDEPTIEPVYNKMVEVVCKICNTEFVVTQEYHDKKVSQGKPFYCSRSCVNKQSQLTMQKQGAKRASGTTVSYSMVPTATQTEEQICGVCSKIIYVTPKQVRQHDLSHPGSIYVCSTACKMKNATDRRRYTATLKQVAKKRTDVGIS